MNYNSKNAVSVLENRFQLVVGVITELLNKKRTLTKKPPDFHPKAFLIIFPMPFPWMGLNVVEAEPDMNLFMKDLHRAAELDIDLENPLAYLEK